jgi:hypothetical protein
MVGVCAPSGAALSRRTRRQNVIGNAIAGYIGHKIDASDGEGGALGAAVGVVTWKVAKTLVPAAIVIGAAAFGARYVTRRFQEAKA